MVIIVLSRNPRNAEAPLAVMLESGLSICLVHVGGRLQRVEEPPFRPWFLEIVVGNFYSSFLKSTARVVVVSQRAVSGFVHHHSCSHKTTNTALLEIWLKSRTFYKRLDCSRVRTHSRRARAHS